MSRHILYSHRNTRTELDWAAVRVTRLWRRGDRCSACASVFILIKRNLRRRGARDTPCTGPGPRPLAMHFLRARSLSLSLSLSPSPAARATPSVAVSVSHTNPFTRKPSTRAVSSGARSPTPWRPPRRCTSHTRAHTNVHLCTRYDGKKTRHDALIAGKPRRGGHVREYITHIIYEVQRAAAAICVHQTFFFFFFDINRKYVYTSLKNN